jgi:hypothetical protein
LRFAHALDRRNGKEIGLSPLFTKTPTFHCALVQSIAGGNTIVFNQRARELLALCGDDVDIPSHDWWLYQVTSACAGKVHYDPYPSVRYRQHTQNVVGSNVGWAARIHRLHMFRQGRFRHWADLNVVMLARIRPRMNAENRQIFDLVVKGRHPRQGSSKIPGSVNGATPNATDNDANPTKIRTAHTRKVTSFGFCLTRMAESSVPAARP